MSLDAAARRRFARQLLLGEIGEAGQERLLDANFTAGLASDASAFAAAADYLRRAGCPESERGRAVQVPDATEVARFAGAPFLNEPAAAVMGAFSAVEHLKEALGIGDAQGFPSDVRLSTEA